MNHNILNYEHKFLIPKEYFISLTDEDFKFQVIINFRNAKFSKFELILFYKHLRNINMCLNKLIKYDYKDSTYLSLKNSIKFLYLNYLESFVDSILSNYLFNYKEENKNTLINKIIYEIWEIDNFKI